MDLISILLIAVGLAMDAFAVSITCGVAVDKIKFSYGLLIASSFGFFQAAMPLLGWISGRAFFELIEPIDHWVAFTLLILIGLRMIFNSFKKEKSEKILKLSGITLLLLSIATSIDALAVGLSFSFININIIIPAGIIGIITFFLSMTGLFIGKHVGNQFGKKAELLGAAILIFIAFRIVITHVKIP